MSRASLDKKLEALSALRTLPVTGSTHAQLRKALRDQSNYVCAKAAALAGELELRALMPDLLEIFDRHLAGGSSTDTQCWAKNAIAETLARFGDSDACVFLRGMAHFQAEPIWGGNQDTAVTLRGICALALAQTSITDQEALTRLVDLLGDPEKPVRSDAVRAIALFTSEAVPLLLRLKAIAGDSEAEVTGQCFVSLLEAAPQEHMEFVRTFLKGDDDLSYEAAIALGGCKDPASVQMLTEHFDSAFDATARKVALVGLGTSRHDQAKEFLLSQAGKGAVADAAEAIRALANSRYRDTVEERLREIVSKRRERALANAFAKEFTN
jgi:HEAT repeat protein